ncbi:DUF4255 domain-containing protein [Pyxidicoccus sp. 3LG]
MLHDLDSTLMQLLNQQLPAELVKQITISFQPPNNQFPPSGVSLPAVDFFLYDVRENLELRNLEPTFEQQPDGRVLNVPAPVRVNCSYLVTAWPRSGVPSPEQDEHRLLGEVMKVLFSFRELPSEVLQGSMKTLRMPLRASLPPSSNLQSLGEFWQALGGKPRAALNYTVTLAVDVWKPVDVGTPALDVRT